MDARSRGRSRRSERGAHAAEYLVHRAGPRRHRVQPRQTELPGEAGELVGRSAGVAAQLLAAPREEARHDLEPAAQPLERRGDDRRIVLAVDQDDGTRQALAYRRPSSGTGQMYFSNDAVDGTKSISVSSPWKGYLRATRTRSSSRRITL